MNTNSYQSGLSLFELLIALAVVGILSGVALPAYRSYIDTANMTRVASNFEQGVKLAQGEFQKQQARLAMGLEYPLPESTADWVALFNESGVQAPGGGDAFIASNNRKSGRGDANTGAVGVQSRKRQRDLRLWRPMYSSLREQRATITSEGVDITNQRRP